MDKNFQKTIDTILQDLKSRQSSARYKHTIGVMYTAAALCMKYKEDIYKGMLAGVLHDCGKLIEIKDYVKACENYGITFDDELYKAPHLLHGLLGAYFAKTRYDIHDEDILRAIEVHTTGCPNMSLLDKIIFVADYIEPDRDEAEDLELLRHMAFENIDKCIVLIAEQTMEHLKRKNYYIGKTTIETYNYYKNKLKGE